MDDPKERRAVPEPRQRAGLKEGIETVSTLVSRLWTAAVTYDKYSPGDEFRLTHKNGSFFSLVDTFLPIIRGYFGYEVVGLENVPASGRAVLVANHGILPVDALLLHYAIRDTYGRWPRGLTDRRIFRIPLLRQIFMDLGIVLAHPETGQALLEQEEIVTIMPGGSREAFKPSRERYQLMWKRRKGYVRLAIADRVTDRPGDLHRKRRTLPRVLRRLRSLGAHLRQGGAPSDHPARRVGTPAFPGQTHPLRGQAHTIPLPARGRRRPEEGGPPAPQGGAGHAGVAARKALRSGNDTGSNKMETENRAMLEPKEFFVLQEFEHREIFPRKRVRLVGPRPAAGLPCGPVRGKHGPRRHYGAGREAPGDLRRRGKARR